MKHLPVLLVLPLTVGLALYACSSSEAIDKDSSSAGSSSAGTPGASPSQGGSSSEQGGSSPQQGGSSAGSDPTGQGGAGQNQGGSSSEGGFGGSAGQNAQAGSSSAGAGGSGGSADKTCPTQDTAMVRLTTPSGTPYCIDRTEVTQAQYAAFLAAKKGDLSGQDSFCASTNLTYEPLLKTSDDQLPACSPSRWDPKGRATWPIECVDMCDARAYCGWVGKRLCGRVGGGTLQSLKESTDPETSQWYNACSQGGKNLYGYGPVEEPSKCPESGPLEEDSGCHADNAPYSDILNLSGNLSEMEDNYSDGGVVTHAVKGSPGDSYRCTEPGSAGTAVGVSFRCCADL